MRCGWAPSPAAAAAPPLTAVHETVLGLAEVGVMHKQTLKTLDVMCLTPIEELTPGQIRQIRLRGKAS